MDVAEFRAELARITEERATLVAEVRAITSAAGERATRALTTDERSRLDAAKTRVAEIDQRLADAAEFEQRVREADEFEAEQDKLRARNGIRPGPVEGVQSEPDMYRQGGEHSFFGDLVAGTMHGDVDAARRISEHNAYERRRRAAVGGPREQRAANDTGSFSSLVPQQFLTDEFAPVAREGRPLANAISSRPLPPRGMTLTIPRGQTGTLVTSQTTENTEVSSRTYTTDDLDIPVITLAGFNDISFQSIARGENVDEVIMADLTAVYAQEQDRQIIDGTGSNNQHFGILSTTDIGSITVTSTGAITQLRQIISSFGTLRTNRGNLGPQAIVMHPRRWAFFLQAVDENGRPVLTATANGPFNTFGNVQPGQDFESDIAGFIHNVPVLMDANVPTSISSTTTQGATEDAIIVTRISDHRLWEPSPVPSMVMVRPDAKNLTDTVVAWNWTAYTAARYPTGTLVLTGSGLTTPPEVG